MLGGSRKATKRLWELKVLILKRIVMACLLALLGWMIPAHNTQAQEVLVFNTNQKTKPIILSSVLKVNGPYTTEIRRPVKQSGRYIPNNACSCVLFVKAKTGFTQSVGAARNWPINSQSPLPGGVVITRESSLGHVAYILEVNADSIVVIEGNYSHCKVTTRTIPLNSPIIKGYWYVPLL